MQKLHGKVAVVTGASRGAGRGIAVVLGEEGATVYVTGRSVRGGPTTDNMPGTIEDTAEAVAKRGGKGIAVQCDHTHDAEVEALFERVKQEQGRLDVLVNNAWGGYEHLKAFGLPFWKQPLALWDAMFVAGLRAHLVATRAALPLMLPPEALAERPALSPCGKCGLAVYANEAHRPTSWPGLLEHERDCVGELARVSARALVVYTVAWSFGTFIGNVPYDTAKGAVVRLAYGIGFSMRPWGIASVALAPGWTRTERVMAAHAAHPFDLSHSESPEYIGRGIAALAADPNAMRFSGRVLATGELAREYGVTDVDGSQPEPFRSPWGNAE
jgi:NAD(P)-dependent dehydrogenase (short-subunit alcohol dehydrogenase family)